MSLGVLNNLSALYAANNLNNTNNSLNKTLQQLSSGSKINSGADDAAGLSLVLGLQANQQALSQSQTNATEGVGLLQVADGALSQVTSLLNRAVTLATEAANGTLNSTQDMAANQEYQSILSEISNIGSTTTYNQQQVFNSKTNIYTGDSSAKGASITSLNISALSSANVGDTGGAMSYSNGQNSVFLNLSSSSKNAQSTDTLNASHTSTINVNYLVKGSGGASTPASTSISVGNGTSYANTADGLISAINDAGLGLTASFATQSQAGVAGGGIQTGIQISGGLVSVGVDPNAATTSGTLNPSEITSGDLALNQTITVKAGSTTAAVVTIGQTNNTLAGLADAINSGTGGAGGVTATLVYNSAGTATGLQLADSASTGGELSVTTATTNVVPNALTPGAVIAASSDPSGVSFAAGAAGAVGVQGTATLSIGGAGSNMASQVLSGSITLSNGTNTKTFVTGGTAGVSGNTVTLGTGTSTLNDLAAAITANLGATAVANSSGISISSVATGTNITLGTSTLKTDLSAGVTSNVAGMAATSGTNGNTTISMTGDAMGVSGTTALATGTHITLKNGAGSSYTYTMGSGGTGILSGLGATTANLTAQSLVDAINTGTATTGMGATITNGKIVVNSTSVNTSIVASANNLSGNQSLSAAHASVAPPTDAYSHVDLTTATGNPLSNTLTGSGDTLSGSITIGNGSSTATFVMGGTAGWSSGTTYNTGASTLASLKDAINNASAGATATWQNASHAADGLNIAATSKNAAGDAATGLTLTANALGTTIAITGPGIVDSSTLGTYAQGTVGGAGQRLTSTLSTDNGGILDTTGATSEFAGSFTINQTGATVNGGAATSLTVVVGAANKTIADNTATTMYVQGTAAGGNAGTATMAQIASAITAFKTSGVNTGGQSFDVTGSVDGITGGLTVQAGDVLANDSVLSISGSTLHATQNLAAGSVTAGSIAGSAIDTITNASPTSTMTLNDILAGGGTLTIGNTAGSENSDGLKSVVFTIGAAAGAETGNGTNAVLTGAGGGYAGNTLGALVNAINAQTTMNLEATVVNGALQIRSTDQAHAGTIALTAGAGLKQAYEVGNVAGTNSGVVVNAGTGPSSATNAAVSINTTAQMSHDGSDALGGQLILTNSSNGTAVTFNMGGTAGTSGNVVTLGAGTSTVNDLASAINLNGTLGITASVNGATGALQLQSVASNSTITVGGTGLTDATSEVLSPGTQAQSSANSTGTLTLASGNLMGSDKLGGTISVTANGATTNYVMAGSTSMPNTGTTVQLSAANSTVAGLRAALTANQGLTTAVTNGVMTLTSGSANASPIGISNNSLSDSLGNAPATANLGTFTSQSDLVSGQVKYSTGGHDYDMGSLAGMTVQQLMNKINFGNTAGTGTSGVNGVTATWVPSGTNNSQYGTNQFGSIQLTSNTFGASGNITNFQSGTSISDLNTSATLDYSKGSAYNTGVSNDTTNGVYDSSTNQTAPTGASSNLTSSANGSNGIATISYSHGAGQSLSATDLSSQDSAKLALSAINQAISNVAAQDGYIGAMINTLNSVSQVLATQSENVQSAQNAVQATDYASAASNMSKYQILSQTGISALAQANSMQQEVLKLLQ